MAKRVVHCVIPALRLSPRYLHPLPLPLLKSHSTSLSKTNPTSRYRGLTTTTTMSSDDAYMDFLNKANADVSQPASTSASSTQPTTQPIHLTETIPPSLSNIHENIYTSETDSPFDPVVLKWDDAVNGVWPDKRQFSTLVSPVADGGLETGMDVIRVEEWDPKGVYEGVVRAVKEAAGAGAGEDGRGGGGEVRVYRVQVGVSRVEYFVVGMEREGGRVVGVVARAVES